MAMLQEHVHAYAASWEHSAADFPFIDQAFTLSEKQQREKILDRYIASVNALSNGKPGRNMLTEKEEQFFFADTRQFLREALNFTDQELGLIFSDEVVEVTRSFVRQARQFDPALTFNDIFQACRNMWIMNGLQIVLGMPVKLTPSIFAYSLLYPYTDNLVDDPGIASSEKLDFSANLHSRLQGQHPTPANSKERTIFSLVAMIETEFPRSAYPEVYESLVAIHEAQTRSMQLLHAGGSLSETETLDICIAKGGASVLADGYLVAGKLSKDQEHFLFGYGAYLQLLDDIQDAGEDRAAGLQTIFTSSDDRLETRLNKTYWFGEGAMQNLALFGEQHVEVFASLMRKSMDLVLVEAIGQHPDLYSKRYVADIEDYSPFSFSFIQKRSKHFTFYNGFLRTAIRELAFDRS